MSEFTHSVFLSSCPTDNSDLLNRFISGSNAKQNFASSQIKSTNNIDEIQRTNLELQQKIQLLEREKQEMIERENNLKKINEQIMDAFNTVGSDSSKGNKEIKILEEKHMKEIQVAKERYENLQAQLEQERKQFGNKLSLLENEVQSSKIQGEHLKTEIQKQQHLLNLQNSKYETLLKTAESQKKSLSDQIEYSWKKKVDELEKQLEKEKTDSNNQRQMMLKEMETNLENLKICHEHEKHLLWTKVNGLQNEKNVISGSCEQNQELYNELKRRHKEDRDNHTKEIDQLKNKITQLEQENMKIQHYEMMQLQHENQLKQKEIVFDEERKKYHFKIRELTLQLKKAEQIEKNYQVLIKEKDFLIEDNKKEAQKKLYLEKKKSENLQEAANKIKEDYTKKNAFVIQEILTKEEQIKKLNKEIMKQGVSISKMNLSKTNMTTWLDPNLQMESGRLNSLQNQQNLTSILNQDTIPDINLLSNNVPQITNNNTFLQEFALSFGSPRNLMAHSPQQIDDKYFKIIEQQKQNWQQTLNYSQQGLASSTLSNRNNAAQNLQKQQSSLMLNETIETINANSPQPIYYKDSSKSNPLINEDKIQETQNESEDHSMNQDDRIDETLNLIDLQQNQQVLGQSLLNSKYPSLGSVVQNNISIPQYSQSAFNTAPNSFRQALSTNNNSNSNLELKKQTNSNKQMLSQNNSKTQLTNQSIRCQTVSSAKKKQFLYSNQQQSENDRTPNTSTNLKERKSANSTVSCKTPVLSTIKKDQSQKKQQQQVLSPSNNSQQNFSNYFVQPIQQNFSEQKDQSKRNVSYSTHTSSSNLNSQAQNRNKIQTSFHRNSNSNLDFKRDSNTSIADPYKLNQSQLKQNALIKQNQSNTNSSNQSYISNCGEQQLKTIQNKQCNPTQNDLQNNQQQQQQQQYLVMNNLYIKPQTLEQQKQQQQQDNDKNHSSETVYSYHYNTNPTFSQNIQSVNNQSEKKSPLPLQVNNCNIVESTLISSSNSNSIKNLASNSKPLLRQSSLVKQAELFSHINSLIDILKKKQQQSTSNQLNVQEINFLQRQVQQQAEDYQNEELNIINRALQKNDVANILNCFEKIRNRLVDNRTTSYKQPYNQFQSYVTDYNNGKKLEGGDVYERFYKNVQNQISNHHQLHTDHSETCLSQHTLPNEFDNPVINPVRASDIMKTNIRSSFNFATNQSLLSINPPNSSTQIPQNYNVPSNNKNGSNPNVPIIRNIQLN